MTESAQKPDGGPAFDRRGRGGPPVVFLHGMMFDRRMWHPVRDLLGDDRTTIAIDLPGHGDSPARASYDFETVTDEIAAIASAEAELPPVIVGHSAAALLATVYASRHRVTGVINVDQPLAITELVERVGTAAGFGEPGVSALIQGLLASMDLETLPDAVRPFAEPRPDPAVLMGWQRELTERGSTGTQEWIEAAAAEIDAPYLAICSRSPWDGYGDWLRERISTAEVEVYDVAGHFPHLSAPERFAADVARIAAGSRG